MNLILTSSTLQLKLSKKKFKKWCLVALNKGISRIKYVILIKYEYGIDFMDQTIIHGQQALQN
jgi:hypothetical protein